MLLMILFFVALVVGLIFIPRFFRKEKTEKRDEFALSPLEQSILADIERSNPKGTRSAHLFALTSKPIRQSVKKEIAEAIFDDFTELSEEKQMLRQILAPPLPPPPPPRRNLAPSRAQMQAKVNAAQKTSFFDALDRTLGNARLRDPEEKKDAPAPAAASPAPAPFIAFRHVVVNPFEENFRQEILDIVNFFEGEGEILLQIDALNGFELQQNRRRARHFYESQENVHAFGSECMKKAFALVSKYRGEYSREKIDQEISLLLLNAPLGKVEAISTTLDRIQNDDSEYGYGESTFSLSELLFGVSCLIKEMQPEVQSEMMKRLYEELEEASEKCGTGHVVRLMNVLQGFGSEFGLTLPLKDEIYSKLSILIQREIEKDEKMDDILASDELLQTFIQKKQKELTAEVMQEYRELADEEEIAKCVIDSLDRYSRSDVFSRSAAAAT